VPEPTPLDRFRAANEAMTPGRLVVLLHERLLRDLDDAATALDTGDRYGAHRGLLHAQEIIAELDRALDGDIWSGAAGLSSVYRYVTGLLVEANVTADREPIDEARGLMEPLATAWRQAWQEAAGRASPIPPSGNSGRAPLDVAG
jgi:flagellar secretion chaperone FliS